jgi:hypothetical protein
LRFGQWRPTADASSSRGGCPQSAAATPASVGEPPSCVDPDDEPPLLLLPELPLEPPLVLPLVLPLPELPDEPPVPDPLDVEPPVEPLPMLEQALDQIPSARERPATPMIAKRVRVM